MVTQPHPFYEDLKLTIANQENLLLLVIGSEHIKAKFNKLMTALTAQKSKNPFARYYQTVNTKRFNPQKGMIYQSTNEHKSSTDLSTSSLIRKNISSFRLWRLHKRKNIIS